ncbi:MAG: hypothetical protein ACOVT5_05895 [Armatimonadaceae bacterium]
MRAKHLIWVDCIAGGLVGSLVLLLRGWLAELYGLPKLLVLVMGLANVAYACFSFALALRRRGEHVPLLRVVAVANVLWAVVCVGLSVVWFGRASLIGIGSLVGEAVFVGGLGVLEWRAAARSGEPRE